jgi:hypothetical protein
LGKKVEIDEIPVLWGGGNCSSSALHQGPGPQVIRFRNLLSSARLVSMELMSPTAMLLMPVGTEGRVKEFRGVVRREEFWERL